MQDREAGESVVATPRSGRDNLGKRGHDASHLEDEGALSNIRSIILEL